MRDLMITLKVTKKEKKALQALAKAEGMSLSAFLRKPIYAERFDLSEQTIVTYPER